jgi:methionyl-tRNA formyltransferase
VSVAFFGTAAFGADALRALVARGDVPVALVVSQPDRPAGRGRRVASPPVAVAARELGLPLLQPDRAADAADAVKGLDAAVLVAYGQILREPLLGALPFVNLHPSLLPRWRGAAPVERAIMAGDAETGVAVIELVAELDAGPVYAQARFPIEPRDDAGAVYRRAVELGVPLVAESLCGERAPVPQPAEGVTYAPKLGPADRRVDWARSAVEVDRQVRALAPHIGARAELDGRPVILWRVDPLPAGSGVPGQGEVAPAGGLVIGCGDGAVAVAELQPAGGRRMTVEEYVRGLRAPVARAS